MVDPCPLTPHDPAATFADAFGDIIVRNHYLIGHRVSEGLPAWRGAKLATPALRACNDAVLAAMYPSSASGEVAVMHILEDPSVDIAYDDEATAFSKPFTFTGQERKDAHAFALARIAQSYARLSCLLMDEVDHLYDRLYFQPSPAPRTGKERAYSYSLNARFKKAKKPLRRSFRYLTPKPLHIEPVDDLDEGPVASRLRARPRRLTFM
jgi:hypothetical protein